VRLDRAGLVRASPDALDDRRELVVREFCREKGLTRRHGDVLVRRLRHEGTGTIAEELGITAGRVTMIEHETRKRLGVDHLGPVLAHLEELAAIG